LLVLLGAILVGGGAAVAYTYHLPPFSPPPRPLEPPRDPLPPSATTPKEAEASPAASLPASSAPTANPQPSATAGPAAPSPEPAQASPAPKLDPKVEKARAERADRLVQKARTLLIEGHEHTALDVLRKAEHLVPGEASYHIFEQQALGKLGRAELLIEGHGSVTIDGHRFAAPRKLKVPAGPHLVESAEENGELTLNRGEKRKLHGKGR
jgi:hypothetical protein